MPLASSPKSNPTDRVAKQRAAVHRLPQATFENGPFASPPDTPDRVRSAKSEPPAQARCKNLVFASSQTPQSGSIRKNPNRPHRHVAKTRCLRHRRTPQSGSIRKIRTGRTGASQKPVFASSPDTPIGFDPQNPNRPHRRVTKTWCLRHRRTPQSGSIRKNPEPPARARRKNPVFASSPDTPIGFDPQNPNALHSRVTKTRCLRHRRTPPIGFDPQNPGRAHATPCSSNKIECI